jgi:transposase InsO family protein
VHEFLSDNGGEFDNDKVRNILKENGIGQQLTAPYTPEREYLAHCCDQVE